MIHESQEEDDDCTRIYHSTEMDGAIAYGKPGKRTPLWLSSVIDKEMRYLHEIMQGAPVSEEFTKLLTGEAALEAIAIADACTQSMFEDSKVKLSEIVILFENLFKPRQRRLTVDMVTDFVSSIHNLKTLF